MALMMKGRHMCKESRGARKEGYMISTYLTGVFKSDLRVRNEFMSYIKEWRP
jgi:GTP cyclohydrolase I